jgi:hypothetical protein
MTFMNEYGLLVAVALPVVTLFALEVFLRATGERRTGLFPALSGYPSIAYGQPVSMIPPQTSRAVSAVEPSNDETERIAA